MAGMVGADLEQLKQLHDKYLQGADEIDQLNNKLTTDTDGSNGYWKGRYADNFRHEWDHDFNPHLKKTSQALRDAAKAIQKNIENIHQATGGH